MMPKSGQYLMLLELRVSMKYLHCFIQLINSGLTKVGSVGSAPAPAAGGNKTETKKEEPKKDQKKAPEPEPVDDGGDDIGDLFG